MVDQETGIGDLARMVDLPLYGHFIGAPGMHEKCTISHGYAAKIGKKHRQNNDLYQSEMGASVHAAMVGFSLGGK